MDVFNQLTAKVYKIGEVIKFMTTPNSLFISQDRTSELFNSNVYPLIKTTTESIARSQMERLRQDVSFKDSIYKQIDLKLECELQSKISQSQDIIDLQSSISTIREKSQASVTHNDLVSSFEFIKSQMQLQIDELRQELKTAHSQRPSSIDIAELVKAQVAEALANHTYTDKVQTSLLESPDEVAFSFLNNSSIAKTKPIEFRSNAKGEITLDDLATQNNLSSSKAREYIAELVQTGKIIPTTNHNTFKVL